MSHDVAPASTPEPGRAERLLGLMQKVYSHDLPNQMVALQSLLHLLELDEGERLGSEGREYVGRLHRVAQKAATMSRFLRELGRLQRAPGSPAEVDLALLLPALATDLGQRLPETALECAAEWEETAVRADPRLLQSALVELVAFTASAARWQRGVARLTTRERPDGVELTGQVFEHGAAAPAAEAPRRPAEPALEVVLAGEWLRDAGGRLVSAHASPAGGHFVVLLPRANPHG